ncbi:endothelin-converting enzyme 1 isoform X2 [Fopius arisanus]|uniref:Endothelin-converting enzyme 1 isoform X2 n=2 Tax=Fopius arisanus TaxID=64838 RepID=A0A9R1U805_9HYME|nr:PREDICTED: endothelin-converting enzyme 1 isoform X2 [Fopius arisanus]
MNQQHQHESPSVYSISSKTHLVTVKSRDAYFKKTRKKSLYVLMTLSVLIAGLMASVITLGILYSRVKVAQPICYTEECVRIAASLKESMDTSIDPCENFYQYACGRWSENHPTPDTSMMHSWFSERSDKVTRKVRQLLRNNLTDVPWAVSQAKMLYDSCVNTGFMDTLGLSPLLNLLKELDIPQVPAILGKEDGNFIEKIGKVRRILGKDVLIGFSVIPDPRNRSRNIIILDSPSSVSPLPGDREIERRLKSLRTRMARSSIYEEDVAVNPVAIEKAYIAAVIREVISNGTSLSCNSSSVISSSEEDRIAKAAHHIYELSAIFYYMSREDNNETVTDEDITDKDYMLVDNLQRLTDNYVKYENCSLKPRKIWRPFIEEVCRGVVDLDLDGRDKVLVANFGYIKDLALLLATTDDDKLESAIWWTVVDVVAPHSSNNLRKIWAEYIDKLISIEVSEPRSIHCADVVNYMMGMAVSWLFVEPEFSSNVAPKVVEMLEHIRTSFASLVATTAWMDQKTKLSTLEKSKKMVYVIGHPDWLFEDKILNEYYEGIDMKEDTYFDNMLSIARLMSKTEIEGVEEINHMNNTYWAAGPTDVNAVYTVVANHITIPAAILQFPFYELGLEALNYGAIGTILGHELTHGFDNSGRLYDGDGNLRQWWSNDTILEYKDKVECFIQHYGEYYEEEVDEHIDGQLTLDENIADNGGLREAVLAYRRWKTKHGQEPALPGFTHLSHEQLLFLAFAHLWCESHTPESLRWMLRDSHSPGHVRLKAVLTNSKEFSEAWECPVGAPMNPRKKCRIW